MAFFTVLYQVSVMFILMAVGFFCFKIKLIDECLNKKLSDILLMVVCPVLIFSSFQTAFDHAILHGLIVAAISAFASHAFAVLLATAVFNKRTADEKHRKYMRFCAIYSNCGFIGIPLLSAVIGSVGVLYASVYIVAFSIFQWTHGVIIYRGSFDRHSLIKMLLNPNIIAPMLGVICFLCAFFLPPLIQDSMTYIGRLNTPLALLIIGARMAQVDLKTVLTDRFVWPPVIIRNLVIPFIAVFTLRFFGITGDLMLACLIPIACPVAAAAVLMAEYIGGDAIYTSKVMSLSTLLSILTIPLLVCTAEALPL